MVKSLLYRERNVTIRHLRIFIEVVDCGKMSAAADKLFISQPTVSQAIKELEEHYGMLLFERICKKLYITEKGKKLLFYARNVVKQFDDMEEKMFQANYVEKIRIGATITVGNCILSDVINSFNEINPQVEIYSYVNNTKDIEEKLLKSELDIGIVEGEVKSQDLISIPEVNDLLILACSTKHPFAKKKVVNLSDLTSESFAMREQGSGTRELFERYMLENRMPIKIVFEGNSPASIKKAIIENQCLSVISIRLVEEEIKRGQIHVIQNIDHDWDRYFSVVYHKNKVVTNEMNSLINVVKDYKHVDILQGIKSGKLIKWRSKKKYSSRTDSRTDLYNKEIKLEFSNGKVINAKFSDDIMNFQEIKLESPILTKYVKFTITDVYPGSKYKDTCMSEIEIR